MHLEVIITESEGFDHYIIRVTDADMKKAADSLSHWINHFLPEGRESAANWRLAPQVTPIQDFASVGTYYEGKARFSVRKP